MNKNVIYVDMDGVLANFEKEPNAVERFATEKGFFADLEPIKENINPIRHLLVADKREVYILSASPNIYADDDKIKWIKKYMPWFPLNNVILCRNGEVKAMYANDIKHSTLLDDYGKNCKEWELLGGTAIKVDSKLKIMNLVASMEI